MYCYVNGNLLNEYIIEFAATSATPMPTWRAKTRILVRPQYGMNAPGPTPKTSCGRVGSTQSGRSGPGTDQEKKKKLVDGVGSTLKR
jgi:hypothetical protein